MSAAARNSSRSAAVSISFSTLAAASIFTLVACGGGAKPAASPEGNTAQTPSDSTAAGTGSTAGSATDPSKGAGPSTTTTTPSGSTLPDGGELQGAKLQSSSKTVIENKTEGTPKPQAGSSEPGRRREDIQTIILARRDEARKCYDDGLKAHPGVEGDLVIKWTIDPKGNPTDVMVDDSKSTIHEASIGNCIVEIVKKIKFAESAKGFETRTSYPFNFHPKGPQPGGAVKK